MQIAVVTFDGFNELDSFIAAGVLGRMRNRGWRAYITSPDAEPISMNGVAVRRQQPLEFAAQADAVIVGSGIRTRDLAADPELLARMGLDPARQLIAAQCSGTLLLARLGLLQGVPACTDLTTKPWVIEAGVEVVDAPFAAHGNVATAGGCLASPYLAAWIIARLSSWTDAEAALHYVAPVGEKADYVARAHRALAPYLAEPAPA